jgi:hypothetical protein
MADKGRNALDPGATFSEGSDRTIYEDDMPVSGSDSTILEHDATILGRRSFQARGEERRKPRVRGDSRLTASSQAHKKSLPLKQHLLPSHRPRFERFRRAAHTGNDERACCRND